MLPGEYTFNTDAKELMEICELKYCCLANRGGKPSRPANRSRCGQGPIQPQNYNPDRLLLLVPARLRLDQLANRADEQACSPPDDRAERHPPAAKAQLPGNGTSLPADTRYKPSPHALSLQLRRARSSFPSIRPNRGRRVSQAHRGLRPARRVPQRDRQNNRNSFS